MSLTIVHDAGAPPSAASETLLLAVRALDRRHGLADGGWYEREARNALGARGLFGLLVPRRHGGSQLSSREYVDVLRQLGRIDASLACSIGGHNALVTSCLVAHGSEAQRQRWLPELATGDRLGALCLTEMHAGSDLSRIRTRAVREGDGFRLDGSKAYVTNAPLAGMFVVLARTSPLRFGLFLVPRERSGVTVEAPLAKLGLDGSPTAAVHFQGVELEPELLVGGEHTNLSLVTTSLAWGRCSLAAGALGMLESLSDVSPSVAALCCATASVLRCAAAIDGGEACAPEVAAFAKLVLSEAVGARTAACLRDLLAASSEQRRRLFAAYRDARVLRIFEGTSEVLRLFVVARALSEAIEDSWWSSAPRAAAYAPALARARDEIVARWGGHVQRNQSAWLRMADVALEMSVLSSLHCQRQMPGSEASAGEAEALAEQRTRNALCRLRRFLAAGGTAPAQRAGSAVAGLMSSEVER